MQRCPRYALVAVPVVAMVVGLLPGLTGPAAAATRQVGGGDGSVRLVVRTERGAATDVTRAAEAAGAVRTGAVRRLRSVSFRVASSQADRVRARLQRRADVTSVGVAHRRWLTTDPADPRFGEQRTYLSAIGATSAWDRGAVGAATVRVAIVDSGVDVSHPDLAGKVAGTFNAVTGGSDVRDAVGHGTGTASVAAAATSNGEGMAGAGRDSSLLAVKVADVTGRIFTDDLAAGIVWAVDHGADVINLSLGGPSSDRLERAAVAYARAHDVLVVAAAGNEGTSTKQFPGALPGVIAVGATSPNGSARAQFSSFGRWVDLGAPGRSVIAATVGGGYESTDGTSYSAPLVSGAAALLEGYRPGRTAAELAQALVGGTDGAKLGFRHGLLHVDRSLELLPPASVPTITSPGPGVVVSGPVTVAVTTTAPRVRLALADRTETVTTTGGVASATFESFGLAGGQQVSATDCSAVDQCAATQSSHGIVVDNGAPSLTAPTAGQEVRDDLLTVAATAPGGSAVRFRLGPETVLDASAPYSAEVPTDRLADGPQQVTAVLCRSDGTLCDDAHPSTVAVTVRRLHPAVTRVSPRVFSPDGDGRRDQTRVAFTLDRRASVALVARDLSGAEVFRRSLGSRPAGAHTASWDGRRTGGGQVANGMYTLGVATSDGTLLGRADTPVVVDRRSPRLQDARVSRPRVLPVRDDFQDTVTVSATADEDVRSLRLQVRTTAGALVRTVRAGRETAGAVAVRWNGRRSDGRLVPGTYRVRLVARDRAGNEAESTTQTVVVSSARLVRRAGSLTVTARSSVLETFVDECSEVFRRTRGRHRGWMSYGSGSICTSGDAYAAADHQVRLPQAVRYGTVQVSAYGGRGDRRYRDSARVVYYDDLANLSEHRFRLGPAVGNHRGPRVKAEPLVIGERTLRWLTLATGVSWYDVRSYRVDFTYFVLR